MKHDGADSEASEQAALYALGALPDEEASRFEEHLAEGCEVCRAELAPFEEVVSSLAFAAREQAPPSSVRAKLLARIAAEEKHDEMLQFLTVRASEGEWRELSPGVLIKQLFVDEATRTVTSLYRLLPGAHAAMHTHEGFEQCYVIAGDFFVNDQLLGPGDFTCALAGSVHHTLYTQAGTTLLIVAQQGQEVLEQKRGSKPL